MDQAVTKDPKTPFLNGVIEIGQKIVLEREILLGGMAEISPK